MLVSRMSFAPLKPTLFLTCLKMIWIHEWHTCGISGSASEITVAKRTVVCDWHFYNLNVGIGAPSELKQVDKGQIFSVKRQRSWRFERCPSEEQIHFDHCRGKLETQASSVIFLRWDYIWLLSTSLVRYQIFLTDAAPRFPLEMNTFVSLTLLFSSFSLSLALFNSCLTRSSSILAFSNSFWTYTPKENQGERHGYSTVVGWRSDKLQECSTNIQRC